jgi:hypothetical protein
VMVLQHRHVVIQQRERCQVVHLERIVGSCQ